MNNKKKYVKPQMECYVINNTCMLLVSGNDQRNTENTDDALDFRGELG